MSYRTFKTERAAAKALALALGMKGAAGGWIYRPRLEHLPLSGQGTVPGEWAGFALMQGWLAFEKRYIGSLAQDDDGRWYILRAKKILAEAKAKSSANYAEYLDALANGDADAERLRLRHEGWKLRVHAAYDLAHGGG